VSRVGHASAWSPLNAFDHEQHTALHCTALGQIYYGCWMDASSFNENDRNRVVVVHTAKRNVRVCDAKS
jgi:hypothetical protein